MPENIEHIMREIHIMFAKAEKVPAKNGVILVDKTRVFALLEELNHEVYDAMDRYEETKLSRERSLKKLEEESAALVKEAKDNAEQIYAASIMYTDDAMEELEKAVEEANQKIKETYETVQKQIEDRMKMLKANRKELHDQIKSLSEARYYMELMEKEKKRKEKEAKKERAEKKANEKAEVKEQKPEEEKAEKAEAGKEQEEDTPKKAEIKVRVSEHYKSRVPEADKDKKEEVPGKEVHTESGGEGDFLDDPIEDMGQAQAAVGNFRAEDFNLDAEYYSWKAENGSQAGGYLPEKKGIKNIFKRVK